MEVMRLPLEQAGLGASSQGVGQVMGNDSAGGGEAVHVQTEGLVLGLDPVRLACRAC